MKRIESFNKFNEKRGLWANIHNKRKRGEAPAKPGDEDYPKPDAVKDAQESVVTEEDTLAELNAMTLGQLERIEDYAEMISDRMRSGEKLESWMFSQVTGALDNLNAVHDAMDGIDGVKESKINEPSDIIKDLDKVRFDLIKQVEVLIAKKKELYSNMDIESPMSADEKKLDKDIQSIFSEIQGIIQQKRKISKK